MRKKDLKSKILTTDFYDYLISDVIRSEIEIIASIYLFTGLFSKRVSDPTRLLQALKNAKVRGVDIFLYLNSRLDYIKPKRELNALVGVFDQMKINYALFNKNHLLHAKIWLIDRRIIYCGSHNITQSATKKNIDITIRQEDPELYKKLLFTLQNA